jgi:GntR family transcriptional regulator
VTAFIPDYQRIATDIRDQIRDGRLAPGDKLPTRNELINQFKVSGPTIDAALLVLKTQGWIRGHQGRGTYVTDTPPSA